MRAGVDNVTAAVIDVYHGEMHFQDARELLARYGAGQAEHSLRFRRRVSLV
jgi:hypothetical protein